MHFIKSGQAAVSKKVLPLCIAFALLGGGASAFAQSVDGIINGVDITGRTNFNNITITDNTNAVVEDENGNKTEIKNNRNDGWQTVMGGNDQNSNSYTYESIGGNIINVTSNDSLTIHSLIGGNSRFSGDGSIRGFSIINNVINIGEKQNKGILRADVISGGTSSASYSKSYPFYNVINLRGMTVTGTSDNGRVKIYGGNVGLNGQVVQGNVYGNVINIQDSVVLKNADVYGGQTNVSRWGGHVWGNRINLSGDADLSQDVSLYGAEIVPQSHAINNLDNILNVGYVEEISFNDKNLPDRNFLDFENGSSGMRGGIYPVTDNKNYYLKLTGKAIPWKNNEVKEISNFSSIKIWAMNDFNTPALKLSTGNFTYNWRPNPDNPHERATIIDLTYLTSGEDYGTAYITNRDNDNAASNPDFESKLKDIDLRTLSADERNNIFFAGVSPDRKITVIQAEKGIYKSEDQIKANKLIYGYSLQQNDDQLVGSYTGKAGIDGNDVVWKTGDITVSSVSLPNKALDASGTASSPLKLEKYGYVFDGNTKLSMDNMHVTNSTSTLISPSESWTLVDGSDATSVTGLGNLAGKENEVSYDMSGGAVTVAGKGSTGISSDSKSLTYHLDNPTSLTYHTLDWASTDPVASLDSSKAYDLSGTKVDWSNLSMKNLFSLKGGLNERTLLDSNGISTGLTDSSLVGTEQHLTAGTTLEGTGRALLKNGNVVYDADMHAQAQTHNVLMGNEAGIAALLESNDLVLDTMKNLDKSKDGGEAFATIGGGENRYETGSHITTNIWRSQAGFAVKNTEKDGAHAEYGLFYDYGDGSYRTFYNGRGNGKIDYKGAGIFGKRIEANGTYEEASLRFGRASNDAKNILHDAEGKGHHYKTDSMYNAIHLGFGKILDRGHGNSLDTYFRFFHTHLNGDSFDAGGHYDIDSLDSNVARIGTRWQHQDHRFEYYAGLAYEYEFSGKAYGTADGADIEGASIRGGSVRFEYGTSVDTGKWRVAINGSDYAGKRRGFNGNISLTCHIW